MVSNEENTEPSVGSENQLSGQRIVVLPNQSNRKAYTASISGRGLSKADRIKGVTRSLVGDALDVLSEMREDCHKSPELRENYYQLYHCLDYLRRFCDGKV